jgi:hypothetical protein
VAAAGGVGGGLAGALVEGPVGDGGGQKGVGGGAGQARSGRYLQPFDERYDTQSGESGEDRAAADGTSRTSRHALLIPFVLI